jgi:hypothetical protein
MYGSNVNYGWSNGPRGSEVVELPLAPVRRRSDTLCGINWLSFGIILSLLAAASLALGVADVVLTYQTYMVDQKCKDNVSDPPCDKNNLVWTWVASGIWASLPVFILGIMAIRLGKRSHPSRSSWFELFAFLSAFVFAPAMIVLSALEVYKGSKIYYWSALDNSDDLAKAIIPIVIAGLGLVEFLMAFIAFAQLCWCRQQYATEQIVTHRQRVDVGQRTFVQSNVPAITNGCYSGDCQTNYAPRVPSPRVTTTYGGPAPPSGNGVYYRPPTTTGFSARPTTYNYFSNARPAANASIDYYRR